MVKKLIYKPLDGLLGRHVSICRLIYIHIITYNSIKCLIDKTQLYLNVEGNLCSSSLFSYSAT